MNQTLWQAVSYASLVCVGALLLIMLRQTKRMSIRLADWPNARLKYDADDLRTCFQKAGTAARSFLWCSLALEIALAPALAAVAHNTAAAFRPVRLAMYGLSLLRALLGLSETLCLLHLSGGEISPKHARLSSLLAMLKWGAFGLWAVGMFACLLIAGSKL